MAGGLFSVKSYGQQNVIIYGNPKKSYFRSTFKTITNFGMQKFRIDYQGQRSINLNNETNMEFTIPRYADLLGKTYIVISIPNIWSTLELNTQNQEWMGYEFKWIDELGTNLIQEM